MEYLTGSLWYLSWPILIYLSYKFVSLNLYHHAKMERLEMFEKRFGDQCDNIDPLLEVEKK